MQLTPEFDRSKWPDLPAADLWAVSTANTVLYLNPSLVMGVLAGDAVGRAVVMLRDGVSVGVSGTVRAIAEEIAAAAARRAASKGGLSCN